MNGREPFWKSPANERATTGDYQEFDSPIMGGKFRVTGSATQLLANDQLTETHKARIAHWIYEQNSLGAEIPVADTHQIDRLKNSPTLKPLRQFELLLKFIATNRRVWERDFHHQYDFDQIEGGAGEYIYAALCVSPRSDDAIDLLKLAMSEGYVTVGEFDRLILTLSGHRYLEAMGTDDSVSSQAFVAMWFSTEMFDVLEHSINLGVASAGYRAFTINQKEHSNKIDDEIIGEIRRSRFIIADFTCGQFKIENKVKLESRGGVYFEAGFAMGLGKPVIWTCREDLIEHVHFDTRQYNHITWDPKDLPSFATALERRIRAVVGQGPIQ